LQKLTCRTIHGKRRTEVDPDLDNTVGKKNRGGCSVGAVEECTIFQHALVGVTVTKKNHDDKWI
jgi:hypothetical protein